MKPMVVSVVLVALAAPALARQSSQSGPSLAEVAEKEKERRKAAKKPAKTYTEADLKRGGISTFNAQVGESQPVPADANPSPAPAAGAAPAKTSDELRADKRKELQARLDEQKKLAEVVRKAKADAELELGDVANISVGTRRQQLQKRVDDSNAKLAEIQTVIDAILEEARRAGLTLAQ
jgi:hypothetical protein